MTMSDETVRTPRLTVTPNSVDRVIRYRAGSNAPPRSDLVRRTVRGGPCAGDRRRSRDRRGYASANGNHAHARGADCSAGMSAYPWPRLSLLVTSGPRRAGAICIRADTTTVAKLCVSLLTGPSSGAPDRCNRAAAVSPTFGRLFEGTDLRSLGQTSPVQPGLKPDLYPNVAERLALRHKTVSFWKCLLRGFSRRSRPTTQWGLRKSTGTDSAATPGVHAVPGWSPERIRRYAPNGE
jgi:hypothetical protein